MKELNDINGVIALSMRRTRPLHAALRGGDDGRGGDAIWMMVCLECIRI
jgi:hypothetical protein